MADLTNDNEILSEAASQADVDAGVDATHFGVYDGDPESGGCLPLGRFDC